MKWINMFGSCCVLLSTKCKNIKILLSFISNGIAVLSPRLQTCDYLLTIPFQKIFQYGNFLFLFFKFSFFLSCWRDFKQSQKANQSFLHELRIFLHFKLIPLKETLCFLSTYRKDATLLQWKKLSRWQYLVN